MEGSLAHDALTVVVSAVASVVSTIAVFKSRLDVMDAQRQSDKELFAEKLDRMGESIERITSEASTHFHTSERLMRSTLELVSNLARQEGTDRRLGSGDTLARFLTKEEGQK